MKEKSHLILSYIIESLILLMHIFLLLIIRQDNHSNSINNDN